MTSASKWRNMVTCKRTQRPPNVPRPKNSIHEYALKNFLLKQLQKVRYKHIYIYTHTHEQRHMQTYTHKKIMQTYAGMQTSPHIPYACAHMFRPVRVLSLSKDQPLFWDHSSQPVLHSSQLWCMIIMPKDNDNANYGTGNHHNDSDCDCLNRSDNEYSSLSFSVRLYKWYYT